MEFRYYTLGRAPNLGQIITINGRTAKILWIGEKRYDITKAMIMKQPELGIDQGLKAISVGYKYI